MTDSEIKQYLLENNGIVNAQDCIMKVFNTSPQIIGKHYNYETNMMIFVTKDNRFVCKWKLNKIDL